MKKLFGILLVALIGIGGLQQVKAQNAGQIEKLFASAEHKETSEGDLKGAIDLYKQVVARAGSNRALAAQALLRIAEDYQKLGDVQARQTYAQIVREFAEQPAATAARSRLASMQTTENRAGPGPEIGDRVVWGGAGVFSDGRVSPDGRFVSNTNWETNTPKFGYALELRDLAAGTTRALTSDEELGGNATSSTFSPDGKQIAYGWKTYSSPTQSNELRIVRIEGTGVPQNRRLYVNPDIDSMYPSDWSPDGRWIAAHVVRRDRSGQIAIIGVQDGSFRALKSVGWRGPNKIFFSPDGKYLAYDAPASDEESQRDVFVIGADGSRETRAVEHSAHDVVMGWSPDGRQLLFASDRTGKVGLWAQPISDGKALGAPTLLKPDIGTVYSLGLTRSGSLYLVKDSSTESLQTAPIDLRLGQLSGAPVLENFGNRRPDWSPDGKFLAYAKPKYEGVPAVFIRSADTGQLRELRPALAGLMEPRWLPNSRFLVTAGRDLKGRAAIYQIDAQTGAVSFIADNAGPADRVQVSPDGKKIYYQVGLKSPQERPFHLVERDLVSGEVREVLARIPPSRRGNAELSPDGRFLAFIMNDTSTKTSRLMMYPVDGDDAREVTRVSQPEQFVAYNNISWTPDGRAIVVAKVREPENPRPHMEQWLVQISDGSARKLDINTEGWIYSIRLHPTGNQIAFFTGQSSQEVWALENVLSKPSTRY
jgi:Tol biopolymer transport system component